MDLVSSLHGRKISFEPLQIRSFNDFKGNIKNGEKSYRISLMSITIRNDILSVLKEIFDDKD